MKILYVEDELERNIPRVNNLFAKYLTETQKKKLSALEIDDSGFGGDPQAIEEIVNSTGVVDCYHSFVDGLGKVLNNYEDYSIFIVDRNLVNCHYDYDAVRAIDPAFTEQQYEAFFEREGDYLLHRLVYAKVDVSNSFYFLTAYGANDELRDSDKIKTLIDFGQFKKENFIEKGNQLDLNRLQSAMAKNPSLKVYNQNLQYFNVLKQHVDPETANRFFNVQMDLDDPKKIHDNLGNIRAIYDAIMKCCLSFWPELMRLIDSKGRPTSFGWEWAKALQDESRTNSIQTNFFMSIMRIGSSFGAHKMPEEERIYKPTLDTVYSLSYALRDIILWFEKARPK